MPIDIDKLRKSPAYIQYINELNKDPLSSYKEFTILEETANPMSSDPDGLSVIKDIKSRLIVNPQELEQAYKLPEIPQDLDEAMNSDPEKAYKETFNEYAYGDKGNKELQRGLMSIARKKLIDQGKSPDEVLNSNAFTSTLNFLGNLVSVGSNAFAKGYAALYGKSQDVKIWGGSGWIDALKTVNDDPDAKSIIEKRSKNIPLTPEEEVKNKQFQDSTGGWGTLLNIVADPLILAGAVGKVVGGVATGLKSAKLYKFGKVLQAIEAPIKTLGDVRIIKNYEKSGQLADVVLNNLKKAKDTVQLNPADIKNIDNILNAKKFNKVKSIKTLEDITQKSKTINPEVGAELEKANTFIKNRIYQSEVLSNSKLFSAIDNKAQKSQDALSKVANQIGIRQAIVSDLDKGPKAVSDASRRVKQGVQANSFKVQKSIVKSIKEIKPKLIEKFPESKNIDDILADMIEDPKKYKELPDLNHVHKSFDDLIILEAQVAGKKATPLLKNPELRKEWGKLADKYKGLSEFNPYHSELPIIESKMRDMLSQKSANRIYDAGTLDDLSNDIVYMTHAMPAETAKIFQTLDKKNINNFSGMFRSAISNKSFKQRQYSGTIKEINDYMTVMDKDGKTEFSKAVKELFPNQEKFADQMNDFAKQLNDKGLKFFDTDISRLFAIRSARTARTIEQATFFEGIKQFGSKTKLAGYELPRIGTPIKGLSDRYFDPEVKQAIEKMWGFTDTQKGVRRLNNIVSEYSRDFQKAWVGLTLGMFPSTPLRNLIGNWFNSFLVIKNPGKFINSTKDAINGFRGKDYKIFANGKLDSVQNIMKQAEKRGIPSTTLRQTHVMDREGGVVTPLGKIAEAIGRSPLAVINDTAEIISKLSLFFDKVKEGLNYDDAAKVVFKVLFDYGDLPTWAKSVKNVIPFFTWTFKNLPLQVMNLMSSTTRSIIKAEEDLNRPDDTKPIEDTRFQSDWLKNTAKVQVGGGAKPSYIMLEGLLPTFDINRIIRGASGGVNMIVDDTIKDMTPFIKTPIELVANRNFSTHKDLTRTQYGTSEFLGFEMSPKLKSVLDDWRVLNYLNKGLDIPKTLGVKGMQLQPDKKDLAGMVFSWSLINPVQYDPNFSRILASKDFNQSIGSELNDFKAYMNKWNLGLQRGQQPTQGDINNLRNRIANIFVLINQGFTDGKINKKDRGKYSTILFNSIIGEQPKIHKRRIR
jgi:hypothetical protein